MLKHLSLLHFSLCTKDMGMLAWLMLKEMSGDYSFPENCHTQFLTLLSIIIVIFSR